MRYGYRVPTLVLVLSLSIPFAAMSSAGQIITLPAEDSVNGTCSSVNRSIISLDNSTLDLDGIEAFLNGSKVDEVRCGELKKYSFSYAEPAVQDVDEQPGIFDLLLLIAPVGVVLLAKNLIARRIESGYQASKHYLYAVLSFMALGAVVVLLDSVPLNYSIKSAILIGLLPVAFLTGPAAVFYNERKSSEKILKTSEALLASSVVFWIGIGGYLIIKDLMIHAVA